MAAESLNTAVVMETAHRVLRNHSQRQACPQPPGAPEPSVEPLAEAPGGDLRLVKSVSESHAACPGGGGRGERRAGFWKEAWSPLPGEGRGGEGMGGSQPSGARRSSSLGAPGQQRQLRFLSSSWLSASPSRRRGQAGASVGCWGSFCGLLGDPALLRTPSGGVSSPGAGPASCSGLDLLPASSDDPPQVPDTWAQRLQGGSSLELPGSDSKVCEVSSCPCLPSMCLVLFCHFRSLWAGGAETSDNTAV